jgi:tRNA pseudouridine-54 N-methylase
MVWVVGELKHRLTVRLGDEHVAQLNALAEASGLSRNDVVRRVLLSHDLPTAESLEDLEKLQRLQGDQNRLGGLLKKALTESRDKADIRRTLAEIEKTSARIRVVIDCLARPQ